MLTFRAAALAVMATTALAGNVLNELPNCWDSCSNFVGGNGCSWFDASCICDLANTSNYLSATIQCAKATCKSDWDPSDINRFLAPIEFTCSLAGGVDQGALNGAQSAANVATAAASTSPTATAKHTTEAAETTLRATIVQHSSTAVVDQPLSFGSNGVSSGAQITSIIVSTINIIPVPVSSAASTTSNEEAHTTTEGGIVQATGTLASTPSFESASGSEMASSSAAATSTSEPGGGGTLFDSTSDGSSNSLAGLVIAAYVVAVAVIHAL